jgi:Na+/proline symporter
MFSESSLESALFEGRAWHGEVMSIGTGIGLIVIGAILTFALNLENSVVDLDLIGYILMGAGLVVFIIGLVLATRKRQSVTTVRSGVDQATGERIDQRSTASSDGPVV